MTLSSSGSISISDIQAEFGGSNPASLSEYYGASAGIPTSGTIAIDDFYGASATTVVQLDVYGASGGDCTINGISQEGQGFGGSIRWVGEIDPGIKLWLAAGAKGTNGTGLSGGAGGAGSEVYINNSWSQPLAIAGGGGGGGYPGQFGGAGGNGDARGSSSRWSGSAKVSEAIGGYNSGGAGGNYGRVVGATGIAFSGGGTGGKGAGASQHAGGTNSNGKLGGGIGSNYAEQNDGGGSGGGGGYGGGGGGGTNGTSSGAAGGGSSSFTQTGCVKTSSTGLGTRNNGGYVRVYSNGVAVKTVSTSGTSPASGTVTIS